MNKFKKGESVWAKFDGYEGPARIRFCPERNKDGWETEIILEVPGYIYAPYIPMQVSANFEAKELIKRKDLMDRYSEKEPNKDFYGTQTVSSDWTAHTGTTKAPMQKTSSPHYFTELPFKVNESKYQLIEERLIEKIK